MIYWLAVEMEVSNLRWIKCCTSFSLRQELRLGNWGVFWGSGRGGVPTAVVMKMLLHCQLMARK